MTRKRLIWVCHSHQLLEGNYKTIDIMFNGNPCSAVVFRFQETCLAYRNLCVHMPRKLNCEKDGVFDDTGKHLRCSMHGINYDPITGASVSTICNGEKLTPVTVKEDKDGVWIYDKHVSLNYRV